MKIRDSRVHVLDAPLSEPFAYSQVWYEMLWQRVDIGRAALDRYRVA
jgi:hypothetical protein